MVYHNIGIAPTSSLHYRSIDIDDIQNAKNIKNPLVAKLLRRRVVSPFKYLDVKVLFESPGGPLNIQH